MIHSKLDLNLYRVLVQVYQTRSVSKAADHLHLTQPAISHALAKLRDAFGDPLFKRDGRQMQPTPVMIAMLPKILSALDCLTELPQTTPAFLLSEHEREIRLGLRDLLEITLLPELTNQVLRGGADIKLATEQLALKQLETRFLADEVDVVIDAWAPSHPKIHGQFLFDEEFAVVVRQGHVLTQKTTLPTYLNCKHLVVSIKDSDLNLVDTALAKHQASRNIVVNCEHYVSGIHTVLNSDLVMTMPKSFAVEMAQSLAIDVLEPPVDLPGIPVFMTWHERTHGDPVMSWFRGELERLLKEKYALETWKPNK